MIDPGSGMPGPVLRCGEAVRAAHRRGTISRMRRRLLLRNKGMLMLLLFRGGVTGVRDMHRGGGAGGFAVRLEEVSR